METALDARILDLIATVIECCEGRREPGPGHPPAATVRVLATLRPFLREGPPWSCVKARPGAACAQQRTRRAARRCVAAWTLGQRAACSRRCMRCWWPCGVVTPRSSWTAARCAPSVAGSLPVPTQRTGPNGARNTTSRSPARDHRRAITGDGIPVACAATAANVNDALVFERLFLSAFAVMARIATVFADKGYDAEANRILCRRFGAEPHIHKRGRPHGSGLGQRRWPVERSNAWGLENKRLARRYDRLGFIVQALLQAACLSLLAGRLAREF